MLEVCFFFFNDTATTEIYTLSLHDALPILPRGGRRPGRLEVHEGPGARDGADRRGGAGGAARGLIGSTCLTLDRKSTRLNSSHANISYAVFCLKKKKKSTSPMSTDYVHTST